MCKGTRDRHRKQLRLQLLHQEAFGKPDSAITAVASGADLLYMQYGK